MAGSVVLADAEHVEPHFLGESGLFDEQPNGLGVAQGAAAVGRDLSERVQSQFEACGRHGFLLLCFRVADATGVVDTSIFTQCT